MLWPFSWLVDVYFSFGMFVDAEGDGLFFKIVDLIEVAEEGITDQIEVATAPLHLILMNSKLASRTFGLMEIEFWSNLKNLITNLNTNWLQFWCNFFAWLHDLAEVVVVDAVEIRSTNIFFPSVDQNLKSLLWNSEVRAASIDNGWPLLLLSKIQLLTIIEHILTLKSPLFN